MKKLDNAAHIAVLLAAALVCAAPPPPAAAGEGVNLNKTTKAVECLNKSGMAIINCLRGMGGSDKATRMWFWDYINGKKTSSRSKELRKLNQPGGQVDKTRVGVYCYLRKNRSEVLTDLQRDLGGQGVDAAKAQTGYEAFVKELLEAVKWNLKVKTNPAHAKLLGAQAQVCQNELLAAVGQTLPGPSASAGASGTSDTAGKLWTSDPAKAPCEGEFESKPKDYGRRDHLKYCKITASMWGKIKGASKVAVRQGSAQPLKGTTRNFYGAALHGKATEPRERAIQADDVFQILGRSIDAHYQYYGQGPAGRLYRVRYGASRPREGWIHAKHVEVVKPPCDGLLRWEYGILSCSESSPTVHRIKRANSWAKNAVWVAQFGVTIGMKARVIARSLSKHWGWHYQKIQIGCGGESYQGWIPEKYINSRSEPSGVSCAPVTMFERAESLDLPKVVFDAKALSRKPKYLQAYSYDFRDAGTIPVGSRSKGSVYARSKVKWYDDKYVYAYYERPGQGPLVGWIKDGSYSKVIAPRKPPKKEPGCDIRKMQGPKNWITEIQQWYLRHLYKHRRDYFTGKRLTDWPGAYCYLSDRISFHDKTMETISIAQKEDPRLKCVMGLRMAEGFTSYLAGLEAHIENRIAVTKNFVIPKGRGMSPACHRHLQGKADSMKALVENVRGGFGKRKWYHDVIDTVEEKAVATVRWVVDTARCAKKIASSPGSALDCLVDQALKAIKGTCNTVAELAGLPMQVALKWLGNFVRDLTGSEWATLIGNNMGACVVEMIKGAVCALTDSVADLAKLGKESFKYAIKHPAVCIGAAALTVNPGIGLLCGFGYLIKDNYPKMMKFLTCLKRKKGWWGLAKFIFGFSLAQDGTVPAIRAGCNMVGGIIRDAILAALTAGTSLAVTTSSKVTRWLSQVFQKTRTIQRLSKSVKIQRMANKAFTAFGQNNPAAYLGIKKATNPFNAAFGLVKGQVEKGCK